MTWSILHIADIMLWVFMAGSVAYVVFFSLMSKCTFLRAKANKGSTYAKNATFLVIYPAYNEDRVILHSVQTFLNQDYPKDHYELVVVSDHMQEETNKQLAALPLTLLQPVFEKSSKARALQFAIDKVERGEGRKESKDGRSYSHIVILDADNVVDNDFLQRLNLVCGEGYQAIQCHRTAKNADNDIAALDGLSEEINNTIFRRAHNNTGLSSALIGSGMCFDYQWFKENVGKLSSAVEDREMEVLLALQHIYVKYEESIWVRDEKVSSQDNFQHQRQRWITGQIQTLLLMLPHLPKAIQQLNFNYIDKTIQQMLIPRSILLVSLPLVSILITLLSPLWSIKWWSMLVCFVMALLLAIPSPLRSKALFSKLGMLSKLSWHMTKNLTHVNMNNQEFIHTTHDK